MMVISCGPPRVSVMTTPFSSSSRRVVENLELSWPAQRVKLAESGDRFLCSDIATHDSTGRVQPMLSMPVAKLPL
jgi:hypothetical protein